MLSIEVVPKDLADTDLKNGFGRSEPNVHPTLASPEGRLEIVS